MSFHVVIPARYQSSRLPGKLLMDIGDKKIIHHVYERALRCGAQSIVIATDDDRIAKIAKDLGADVCMTDVKHQSGTERIAEVCQQRGYGENDIILNVQADEPFISPNNLKQLAQLLMDDPTLPMATLCEEMTDLEQVFTNSMVKVVMDKNDCALYFSRAAIPWDRDGFAQQPATLTHNFPYYRHIGLYGYRAGFIKQYVTWQPSPLEQIESLEQLRVLWYGHKIKLALANEVTLPGIDTPADLDRARKYYAILQQSA